MNLSDIKITKKLVKSIEESKDFSNWCNKRSCHHNDSKIPCEFGERSCGVYLERTGRNAANFCEPLYNKIKTGEIEIEQEFEFQVGDIVTVPWLSGEHVLVNQCSEIYPIRVRAGADGPSFTKNGRYDEDHELPVLKLVRRPKKEMTFERIKSEGISKLKCESSIRHVIGFSPVDGSLITVLDVGGATGAWRESKIKDWEAVE